MINKSVISGNLCRDPELRSTANGLSVMSFVVAVNEKKKTSEGWEEYANYIDCVIFGTRAEKLADILKKGMKLCVIGRLHQDRWEDKGTGGSRSKILIYVDEVELMSKSSRTEQATVSDSSLFDEDLPF